jgi:hypothetical protein
MHESAAMSGLLFESLPFDEKKKLVNEVFGGQDENGNEYGVYVKPLKGKPRKYEFTARGRIGDIRGIAGFKENDSIGTPNESKYVLSSQFIQQFNRK